MKKKSSNKWELIRKKGKPKFVLINGVIAWGITTAILWSIIMEVISPSEIKYLRPIIALIVFPIGGYFWGLWMWKSNENKYLKEESNSV